MVYEDAELALVFGVKTNPSKRIVRKNKHDHLTEDDIKSFILSYLENEGYEALSVEIKDELSEKMKLLDEIFEGIR